MKTFLDAAVDALIQRHALPGPVYVTRPALPPLDAYAETLRSAWESCRLSNMGPLHERLENDLAAYLGVPRLLLFCNGTIALLTALRALGLESGEIITTPFTFPATVNVLRWLGLRPVFGDVDPITGNLDPASAAALATSATRAILPVHVYGAPCDLEAFDAFRRRGIPLVYDAAHAFGVRCQGRSLAAFGDVSMLSFHATKMFTTGEGGALVCDDEQVYQYARKLRNFGIVEEDVVEAPGINGKMSELNAALGLLQLRQVNEEIAERRRVADQYARGLSDIPGLRLPVTGKNIEPTWAYFPVFINADEYGMDRDALHGILKRFNIITRRYFNPLCSTFPWCAVPAGKLPVAERLAKQALCLPIYGSLDGAVVDTVCLVLSKLGATARGHQ